MLLSAFHFELPDALIAREPMVERRGSRLLHLNGESGAVVHRQFADILDLIEPGDLLVFNDTRVIPARLYGQKASGGKVEVLIERVLGEREVLAHVRASKSPKPGSELVFGQGSAKMLAREGDLFHLRFDRPVLPLLEVVGHMPLPPYIGREDTTADRERYQTVYGVKPGAVAAPTAGLHFDSAMLEEIAAKGAEIAFVTLHVGAGTFQPVRAENIKEHHMHSEWVEVSAEVCDKVREAKARGGRVLAVGTTSVRCLESAAQATGEIQPFTGDTNIFIYPGYQFRVIDRLITNFHLPESTLIMLVSAFAGYRNTMNAYRAAVEQQYRFFSYGDAMLIECNPQAAKEELPQ